MNNPEDVKLYMDHLQHLPNLRYPGGNAERAEIIAANIVTEDELKAVNETLSYLRELYESDDKWKHDWGFPGDVIRGGGLQYNEDDYIGMAKLICTTDKYDDMKLLFSPVIYNKDYSERITDKETIERIQDKFGEIRETYYGSNSMMMTLDAQLGMALNAHDAKDKKESEQKVSLRDQLMGKVSGLAGDAKSATDNEKGPKKPGE